MTEPRTTPEMSEKLAAVRDASTKLRENHVIWILDAAIEHFAKQVEETELDILRYEHLPEAAIYTIYGRAREAGTPTRRDQELPRLRGRLAEYTAILDFLDALKNAESLRSVESFAAAFRASGGFFGAEPPRPAPRRSGGR
jgi:hypothetical protein